MKDKKETKNKSRACGRRKNQIFPKSRKSYKNKVPNPRTTNSLHLSLDLEEDQQNKESRGNIREIVSPYLVMPDYLSSMFAVQLEDIKIKKGLTIKYESVIWKTRMINQKVEPD